MNRKYYERLRALDTKEIATYIMSIASRSNKRFDDALLITSYSALALYLTSAESLDDGIRIVKENFYDEATSSYLITLLEDDFDSMLMLSRKFDAEILKAAALNYEPWRNFDTDNHNTPKGIVELAISLLQISSEDSVLDIGSGIGSFLVETGLSTQPASLTGIEINPVSAIISNIRSAIAEIPVSIIQGNVLTYDFNGKQFDKIFSNAPFGIRFSNVQHQFIDNRYLGEYFKYSNKTATGDWAYTLSALRNQKETGKTAVVMSNAGMWNKSDEDIRRKLVLQGSVEGVISLPGKLLGNTAIPLTVVVFSRNNTNIRMVDAASYFTQGRRINELRSEDIENIINSYNQVSSNSCVVSLDEVANQEFILNPQRYLSSNINTNDGIPLGNLCIGINRGAMITSSELDRLSTIENTDNHYLMLQNISGGFIDSRLPTLTQIDDKYRKYCIRDKNLIVSKISPFKVAMAHVAKGKSILANGNLYFIELDEGKVNPVFVECYLQSEPGIAQLVKYSKGTVMKSLSIQDLKAVRIPNLSRETQDKIADKYLLLRDDLTILRKQADITRDKIAHLFEEVSGS